MNLDVNQIKTEAKQITDRNLLAVIHLTNITPTRIGGYNAKPYSHELELAEGFRTSEVKGIWRWWLRTTLAGALWDLHGETDEKIVKEKTNQLLGSTESASKFALKVSVSSANTHKPDMNIIKNIPRLRMLTMKKGDAKHDEQLTIYPSESLKITISLYEQAVPLADTSSRRVAFGTLLLALLLQGMGAVTRRGFGHFQITLKNTKNDLDNYRKITEEINLANNVQQMQKAVDGFIEQV
ncbi:MAG: type III-B CRISPR module RAMP protein Cmr1, partial [Candidatus Caldarchaeum sp.]|nr:type III-B CRISPR module RAMP protein Cmr1 [Candidatus Caldarchaeum sp.]MDW8436254.1 type III-B CRISPR module RAMP protein Cmr1 [Candidatus Caldarchaeum sp.]